MYSNELYLTQKKGFYPNKASLFEGKKIKKKIFIYSKRQNEFQ